MLKCAIRKCVICSIGLFVLTRLRPLYLQQQIFSFLDLLTADSNTDEAVAEAERQAGSTRATAEKIAAKDRSVINDWNNRDRALSESFAQRLREIIDEMKLNTVVTTEIVEGDSLNC